MAMHLNENLDDNGEMHDINVTPFIDVMLVLLIIFMVAAPLATVYGIVFYLICYRRMRRAEGGE